MKQRYFAEDDEGIFGPSSGGTAEDGEPSPEPVTTSFDFGEIRDEAVDHYVVEWLEVELPEVKLLQAS